MDNPHLKLAVDDFEVEYEILPLETDNRRAKIQEGIAQLDEQLKVNLQKIGELNTEIDRLTNHADGLDYAIAVVSGIITGIIDSVFVGKWDFKEAKDKANRDANNKVTEFVKKDPRYIPWCNNTSHGRKIRDPDRLSSAIEFLEEHYHLPGDNTYQKGNYGITGNNHRLDDFCHHPTLIGLLCCIIVQFTGKTVYSHDSGTVLRIPISIDEQGDFVGTDTATKVMSGVVNWFITCAKTIATRKGHLMSDIATSAGIPGSLLSTLKELSALPCFKDTMFSENLRKAYQNGIGSGKNQIDLGVFNALFEGAESKFDQRTENAIKHELKKQSIPVIINEALVRGFYFVRRFIEQMKIHNSVSELDWKAVLPFRNRTIVRMMTIATGTFTAFDAADAAIRAIIESGGVNANTAKEFILRVNFVGIGRFAIAVASDVGMEIKRSNKRAELSVALGEHFNLTNVKVYYRKADIMCSFAEMYEKEAEMHSVERDIWIEAQNTAFAMEEVYAQIYKTCTFYMETVAEMDKCLDDIAELMSGIDEKNPGLRQKLLTRL